MGLGVVLLTITTVAATGLTLGKGLVRITFLLIITAFRMGMPIRNAVRDDLAQEVDVSACPKRPS